MHAGNMIVGAVLVAIALPSACSFLVKTGEEVQAKQETVAISHTPGGISVQDFMLDRAKLGDAVVTVVGRPMCLGELCFLYAAGSVAQSIVFVPSQLPREDRKRMLGNSAFTGDLAGITFRASDEDFSRVALAISWSR